MKVKLFIITLSIFVVACSTPTDSKKSTHTTHPQTDSTSVTKEPKVELKKLTHEIYHEFVGYWMSETLLTAVEKSKSVYASRKYPETLFGFYIEEGDLKDNKTKINGFTEHEGGYNIGLQWDEKIGTFTSKGMTEEFSAIEKPINAVLVDSDHLEFQYEDGKKEVYRKVKDCDIALRSVLFQGEFTDINGQEYMFTPRGNMDGFKNKSYFLVGYDFVEGLEFDYVRISKNKNRDEEEFYHYKFEGNSLKFYEIDGEFPEISIGKLGITLTRTN